MLIYKILVVALAMGFAIAIIYSLYMAKRNIENGKYLKVARVSAIVLALIYIAYGLLRNVID